MHSAEFQASVGCPDERSGPLRAWFGGQRGSGLENAGVIDSQQQTAAEVTGQSGERIRALEHWPWRGAHTVRVLEGAEKQGGGRRGRNGECWLSRERAPMTE